MTTQLITQVAHTCIFAHDLEKTANFYRDVFGIARAFDFKRGEDWIGFYMDLGARTFIEVFRKAESSFAESNQINHICLETEDLDGLIAHGRHHQSSKCQETEGPRRERDAGRAEPCAVRADESRKAEAGGREGAGGQAYRGA